MTCWRFVIWREGDVGNRSLHRKRQRSRRAPTASHSICLLTCICCTDILPSLAPCDPAEPLYERKLFHVPIRCSSDCPCVFASHLDFSSCDYCAFDCVGDLLVPRICNAKPETSPSRAKVHSTNKPTISFG